MTTVDARGDVCPIPLMKAKEAIKNLNGAGDVEVLVDNEIAVQNLEKMAGQMGYGAESSKTEETADHMGEGNEELGKVLIKGFLFAQTQLETLPDTILFYNGGAKLTCEGSDSIEDLKKLEAAGVQILTCGTCLNYYGLTEKLQVGGVTNMYVIAQTMAEADLVVRP